MKDWTGKRYWLVGASEGLGRELALTMSRAGVEVIVSARSEDRLKDLVDELPGKASYVTVDVTDRAAVEAAAKDVGPIDGMVYLAGCVLADEVRRMGQRKGRDDGRGQLSGRKSRRGICHQ